MSNNSPGPSPSTSSPQSAHVAWLVGLGAVTTALLIARAGLTNTLTAEAAIATIGLAVAARVARSLPSDWSARLRFLACLAFIAWYYSSVARLVPSLRFPLRDDWLRAADEAIFGAMPAVVLERYMSDWLTDVASGGYLMYLVYLQTGAVHALFQSGAFLESFGRRIGLAYVWGLAGYLAVPAVGPHLAFPDLFTQPLDGSWLTESCHAIVGWGSSIYDTFPSLHVLVTVSLLTFDWRHCRRRFWIMLAPAVGIVSSTIYLRYHYVVDLLAGAAWLVPVYLCEQWPSNNARSCRHVDGQL